MRKLFFTLAAVAALSACTNAEKGAAIGAIGGAALGTAAGGNDTRNAIIGAGVGAIAGSLIGASMDRKGYCRYRAYDRYGRAYIYEDRCR